MSVKALVILGEGFEEAEAIVPVDIMRRAGFEVVTLAAGSSLVVTGSHGIKVVADALLADAGSHNGDVLVLPGGPGTKRLAQNSEVCSLVEHYVSANKFVAAICAAPMIPGTLGLLRGHKATCYPGSEQYLKDAIVTDAPVEVSGRFITARGAGVAFEFGFEIVRQVMGEKDASEVAKKMMTHLD